MHLAHRSYALLALTGALAIGGMWSGEPALGYLWTLPLALLLAGVALEGLWMRGLSVQAGIESAPRAFLGRAHCFEYVFRQSGQRPLAIEYLPAVPAGFELLGGATAGAGATRLVQVPAAGAAHDSLQLLAVRLGPYAWPALHTRRLGRLGLIWWSYREPLEHRVRVAPDIVSRARMPRGGSRAGSRPQRGNGAGSELHQLRDYVPGDPLGRVDWKATARLRRLISRELEQDQHLDIVLALDAGRGSRVRAGPLDRLGVYANLAARLAESATANDDRVGLLVYSEQPLAVLAPARGRSAVLRLRRTLERLEPQAGESDPLVVAMRLRSLLKHRSLVVLLADLEDPGQGPALARAVRLLAPPHVVLVAGILGAELEEVAQAEARSWRDPWIALAAREEQLQGGRRRALLRRLGAPVVSARADELEQAVLDEYQRLRASRRI